jgi:GxxExxY protein
MSDEIFKDLTEKIIGCAYTVSNTLGTGFFEKVYENALAIEIQNAGLGVRQQQPIQVYYNNAVVGEYVADLIIENRVLVELKAIKAFDDVHFAQCINYLKDTGMRVCLLINFGRPIIEIKRFVN